MRFLITSIAAFLFVANIAWSQDIVASKNEEDYGASLQQAENMWYEEYKAAEDEWYAAREVAMKKAYDIERAALKKLRADNLSMYYEYLDAHEWSDYERIDVLEVSSPEVKQYLEARRTAYAKSDEIEAAAKAVMEDRKKKAAEARDTATAAARAKFEASTD